MNRRREGVETEAPLPSKRNSGQRINNDAGLAFNGIPTLFVTILVAVEEPMKDAIECANWHLPSAGTRFFWNQHQAGSTVILGSITNISNEIEIEALDRTLRHSMEHAHKRLGTNGRISINEVAGGVTPIFYVLDSMRH